jgi:hypothetical protein
MPKILICTAWAPTKSHCFPEYSKAVGSVLEDDELGAELFITTHSIDSKYESIVRCMHQAEDYALMKGFTHVLNVEMDRLAGADLVKSLLAHDKDIVLPGIGRGGGVQDPGAMQLESEGRGWGIMLVKTDVLRQASFANGFRGDYLDPCKMWFKLAQRMGYKVWIDEDIDTMPLILERETPYPTKGFIAQ